MTPEEYTDKLTAIQALGLTPETTARLVGELNLQFKKDTASAAIVTHLHRATKVVDTLNHGAAIVLSNMNPLGLVQNMNALASRITRHN